MKKEPLEYDERSGTFMSQGTDYGCAKRNPVGSFNVKNESPIPDHCYTKFVEQNEKEDGKKYS